MISTSVASIVRCMGVLACVTFASGAIAALTDTPRLVNIATRGQVLTGSDVMIGGFVIGGSANKTVVVRARGPSLTALGVPGALANPMLQLFSGATQIAVNDNWGDAANVATLQASGYAPSHALESAVYTNLAPGAYTAIVSGVGSGTGVGLVEVFEVDHPEVPLINIATRGKLLTGSDVMIGGFIIQGIAPQAVVVRARGPSLTAQGVPGVLADPVLQLVRSSDGLTLSNNDNWATSPNAAQITASGFAPSNNAEAAILVTLDPGAYTAVVTGAASGTGVGIVEVFALDSFALTVTKAGTGAGTVTSTTPAGLIACGTTCSATATSGTSVTLAAAPSGGATFSGWSGACTGTGTCVVTMDQARAVTATFAAPAGNFALTVTRAGTGTGTVTSTTPAGLINCGATCSANVASGTSVTLAAAAAGGSTFAGWTGACTGTGTCVVTMDQARAVTATFTAIGNFTLTVTKNGTGTGTVTSTTPAGLINCGATCSASVANGTSVTLTATPSAGSNFTGWSGACTGTNNCVLTMDQARDAIATFDVPGSFALTVAKAGTGAGTVTSTIPASPTINCGATCSATFASGTSVTLVAAATAGSTFGGWSGACTGTGNCVVTVDAAKSVTATFALAGAGKTYYILPTGLDTNNGLSAAAPFKTFAKAWGVLVAGDTLMVGNGTYTGASPPTGKAGAASQPIVVQATNPGGVSLGQLDFKGASYITLIGFKVSGPDYAISIYSNGTSKPSHHLTFQQIGFSCTPGTLNDGACFDMGDGAHHILLEDSWGYGGGRYTILCYGGPGGSPPNLTCDNNTFRRVVLRMGPALSSGGNPQASVGLYYASNNIVENVIAIDGNANSDSSNSAFYITGHAPPPNADANKFYGVIALNNKGGGLYLDCPGAVCNANEVHNSVFWASQQFGIAISASSSAGDSCANVIINRNTSGVSGTGESGYDNYACDNATLTNNAFYNNTGYGARQSSSQGSTTTNHHNGYFGNTLGARQNLTAGAGDLVSNPGFSFITRIESASPYKNAGLSGDIGATVVNRYQDGVLTATPLWPYPFEARLRAEMCATSVGAFCASGKTLTHYIWEYLGNPSPAGL